MQRIFFHNPHDKDSIAALAALSEGVDVFNYFDRTIPWPFEPNCRVLPYLIDKQLVLITQPPYLVGGCVLQFQCQDYEGNALQDDVNFSVSVNGLTLSGVATGGFLEFEINASAPGAVEVEITETEKGYLPWKGEIGFVAI